MLLIVKREVSTSFVPPKVNNVKYKVIFYFVSMKTGFKELNELVEINKVMLNNCLLVSIH